MPHLFRQIHSAKLPQPNRHAAHEEYGRELGGIIECPQCHAVHFKKRWYDSRREIKNHLKVGRPVISWFHLCTACTMIYEHLFEGEVLVEHVPLQYEKELIRLIKNFGARAAGIDRQHRIIEIEKNKSRI